MPKQIDYECTKEEWDTFFDFESAVVHVYVILAFVMSKCKVPSSSTWRGITLVSSLNPGSAGPTAICLTNDEVGTVRLIYKPALAPSTGVPILPKNYRPTYPGSRHFQTQRTKHSRFEGRL